MINAFLGRLFGTAPDPVTNIDGQLALAALLVRLAKADGDYDVAEIKRIDKILGKRFALNAVDAAKLRAQAEDVEAHAPDTVRFTRAIKDAVPYDERSAVIVALWEVALADGERDDEENALLRMIVPLLGITDLDSAHARQVAESRLS